MHLLSKEFAFFFIFLYIILKLLRWYCQYCTTRNKHPLLRFYYLLKRKGNIFTTHTNKNPSCLNYFFYIYQLSLFFSLSFTLYLYFFMCSFPTWINFLIWNLLRQCVHSFHLKMLKEKLRSFAHSTTNQQTKSIMFPCICF